MAKATAERLVSRDLPPVHQTTVMKDEQHRPGRAWDPRVDAESGEKHTLLRYPPFACWHS